MECKEEERSGGNQITKEILPAEDPKAEAVRSATSTIVSTETGK